MDFSELLNVLHKMQNSISGTNGIDTNVSHVELDKTEDSFYVTLFINNKNGDAPTSP